MSNITYAPTDSQENNPSVKEVLDEEILRARKHLEDLCIKKAKLETLGLLELPYGELNRLLWFSYMSV